MSDDSRISPVARPPVIGQADHRNRRRTKARDRDRPLDRPLAPVDRDARKGRIIDERC
jgi:hypothetical protein